MRRIQLVTAVALGLACALLISCGSEDAESAATTATTTTSSAPSPSSSSDDSESEDDDASPGSLEFTLSTSNGDVSVSGTATGCTNPSETTLDVTFSDGTQEVVVSATDGSGTVKIPGVFEGTIDAIAVGDLGNVTISGRGGLADDSAEATTFTVVGNCA